ncbi:MAG: MFS transporter, partial [Alphaproteobacteria bacterium]|nr:MFS transporter [Alphaproteobacteria bacterium]
MTDNGGAAAVTASAWRLSFFFGAVFAVVGVVMPYWPVFLQARGLTPTQIGLVLSAVLWVRVVANPLIAQAVDRRGERRRPLLVLSAATLLGYLGFLVADGFWPLLLASLLAGVAFA